MNVASPDIGKMDYLASEAVGVFPDASSLNEAVAQLGIAGFGRALISVLGVNAKYPGTGAGPYRTPPDIADDPATKPADSAVRLRVSASDEDGGLDSASLDREGAALMLRADD